MANWGGGWIYSPDFYPTGEEIFATGAGSNAGEYSDKHELDTLIKATNTSSSLTALYNYENYLAQRAAGHLAARDGARVQRGREERLRLQPGEPALQLGRRELVLLQDESS